MPLARHEGLLAAGRAAERPRLTIRTPENVVFDFEPAGPAVRSLAAILDFAIVVAVAVAIAMALSAIAVVARAYATALATILYFVIHVLWGALFERFAGGRTPGKAVFGLRVLGSDGLPIDFGQALIRNGLRTLDLAPALGLVGLTSMSLDRWHRRLGDLAAGTVVVSTRASAAPAEILSAKERYNRLLEDPVVRSRARRVTAEERQLMVALCLRRDELPLLKRAALFGALSRHLEQRLGLSRPGSVSEEKLVLSLSAVVLGGFDEGRRPSGARGGLQEGRGPSEQ